MKIVRLVKTTLVLATVLAAFGSNDLYACAAYDDAKNAAEAALAAAQKAKADAWKEFTAWCCSPFVKRICIYTKEHRYLNPDNTIPPADCGKVICADITTVIEYCLAMYALDYFSCVGGGLAVPIILKIAGNKGSTKRCQSKCTEWHKWDDAIYSDQAALDAIIASEAQYCPVIDPCKGVASGQALEKCQCESAGKTWFDNIGQCDPCADKIGTTQAICKCEQKGKDKWQWLNGACVQKQTTPTQPTRPPLLFGNTPSDDGSVNPSGETPGVTAETSQTTGTGDNSSLMGVGGGGVSGSVAKGNADSGMSWYDSLVAAFGGKTSGSGTFQKGSTLKGTSGGGMVTTTKKKAEGGISNRTSDIFTEISTTYTNKYVGGVLADTAQQGSSAPINPKRGTQPVIYKN